MAIKGESVKGRTDVYKVDPSYIRVEEGWNPRKNFGDEQDGELKDSVIENGVLIPLRVKKKGKDNYLLVDGERRLRAVQAAREEGYEIAAVPVIIERKNLSDIDSMVVSLVANTGKPLTPSEEAEAYMRLKNWGLTIKDISRKMGKSYPHITGRLELYNASPSLSEAIDAKEITISDAQSIISSSGGSIEYQDEELESVKSENSGNKRKKRDSKSSNTKKSSKSNSLVNEDEIKSILEEWIKEYELCCNEYYKQFIGGQIRAYSNILLESDPIDLDY